MDLDDLPSGPNDKQPQPPQKSSKALKDLASCWKIGTAPAIAAWADDQKHAKSCKREACFRCRYVSQGPSLAKVTAMLPNGFDSVPAHKLAAAKGCWLASAKIDGEWGLGCIACCASGGQGAFASFQWKGAGASQQLQSSRLEKHAESKDHKRAVADYFGYDDAAAVCAPPVDEFLQNFERLQQGRAGDNTTKTVAMTWCLNEALLDIDREFVKRAKSMAICRDDRAQRLLMRFTSATADLEPRSGVLGIGTAHRDGPDADGIVAATKQVFEQFCTPRRWPPPHGIVKPIDPEIQKATSQRLMQHLQDIVELMVVDEEAAELKAADIGRGRRASARDMAPITPNLKFVARDKAHGFRRNIEEYRIHVIIFNLSLV